MGEVQRESTVDRVLPSILAAGIAAAQAAAGPDGEPDCEVLHGIVHFASEHWGPFALLQHLSATCAQVLVHLQAQPSVDASLVTFRLDKGVWTFDLPPELPLDVTHDVRRAARLIAVYTNLVTEVHADAIANGVLTVGPGARSDGEAWKEHFTAIPAVELCDVATNAFLITGQLVGIFEAHVNLILHRSGS